MRHTNHHFRFYYFLRFSSIPIQPSYVSLGVIELCKYIILLLYDILYLFQNEVFQTFEDLLFLFILGFALFLPVKLFDQFSKSYSFTFPYKYLEYIIINYVSTKLRMLFVTNLPIYRIHACIA